MLKFSWSLENLLFNCLFCLKKEHWGRSGGRRALIQNRLERRTLETPGLRPIFRCEVGIYQKRTSGIHFLKVQIFVGTYFRGTIDYASQFIFAIGNFL